MDVIAQEVLSWLAGKSKLVVQLLKLFDCQIFGVGDHVAIVDIHENVDALAIREQLAEVAWVKLGLLEALRAELLHQGAVPDTARIRLAIQRQYMTAPHFCANVRCNSGSTDSRFATASSYKSLRRGPHGVDTAG